LFVGSYSLAESEPTKISFQSKLSNYAHSNEWLKLLQYKTISQSKYVGDVTTPRFYFSQKGPSNPLSELSATLEAFQKDLINPYTQNLYACDFPSRWERLNSHFPELNLKPADCPELNDWLKQLSVNRASIVYASQYIGNPASLLGHTFLRIYSKEMESENKNFSLLSYAIGFLALPDPNDNQAIYAAKGIFGYYPGFYSMEPFYIKLGLYNNS